MIARLVGALVVLLAFGGCAYLGVQGMIDEQRVGGVPIVPLLLLSVPLLVVGWLVVRIGRLFIRRWQHDYLDHTLGERRITGLAVAALSGGLLYTAVGLAVPSQHPGHDLTAALKPACVGNAVVGAGGAHRAGVATAHLVVLGADGNEQGWTGHVPMEWKPADLADTELVACVSEEDVASLIETCQYINGPAIKRYSATRAVKLVEPGSARVVAEYDVADSPRQCMSTEKREVTELNGRVEWLMVAARLAGYAGCCAPAATPSPARPGEQPQVTPRFTAPPMPTAPAEQPAPVQPETPVP